MACNKNEWHPVHWINYWISKIAKIPSTEQDGGINVMSMGRNGSSLAWMTTDLVGLDDYLQTCHDNGNSKSCPVCRTHWENCTY